ncbi:MAG: threonine synthase [Anaerolineales bacterium]|nr:threonine synthase [Anaerolineales bacterium]
MIRYYSTNGQAPPVTFAEALFQGLAPDGGLYFPDQFPKFSPEELAALPGTSLAECGFAVLQKWFGEEIPEAELRAIAKAAFHFPIELRPVGPYHLLELFHGPTQAFKDVAAQTLARLMSHFLQARRENVLLLVATSGDTGGAIAHGFADIPNIDVVILFPKGRVSALQEEQLTRVAENVHPLEIDGVFDDCQALVKQAFNDPSLRQFQLTSANSISIGRLIPQIVYYVYAYAQTGRSDIEFVVPSGNFGNLTGGLFAREMGLPFDHFVAATNLNDVAVRYLETGRYEPQPTIQTLANAMDVGNPSNFVRVLELFGHDVDRCRAVLRAHSVTDAEAVATIKAVHQEHGYLLDPHTAVGWHVAEALADPARYTIIVGTAAPLKFAAEIERQTGLPVDNEAALGQLARYAQRKTSLANVYDALAAELGRIYRSIYE